MTICTVPVNHTIAKWSLTNITLRCCTNRFWQPRIISKTSPLFPHLRMPNEPAVCRPIYSAEREREDCHGNLGLPTMVLYNKEMTKAQEEMITVWKRFRISKEEEDHETRRQLNVFIIHLNREVLHGNYSSIRIKIEGGPWKQDSAY